MQRDHRHSLAWGLAAPCCTAAFAAKDFLPRGEVAGLTHSVRTTAREPGCSHSHSPLWRCSALQRCEALRRVLSVCTLALRSSLCTVVSIGCCVVWLEGAGVHLTWLLTLRDVLHGLAAFCQSSAEWPLKPHVAGCNCRVLCNWFALPHLCGKDANLSPS